MVRAAVVTCAIWIVLALCCPQDPHAAGPGGLDEARLAIRSRAEKIGTAVLLIVKDGVPVFQFGDVARKYMCHSIRKPLLGALYGIYRERGVIDLNLTLAGLGIDDIPPALTEPEKRATIRDLLSSRSGVYHEAGGEAPSMIEARPRRGSHRPGTFFYYNNWDFNALGTIFMKLTGKDIFRAFCDDVARPIGMQDFTWTDGTYVVEEKKSRHPSYFFRISSRDLARFGILYANDGIWQGRRVIPRSWIAESTFRPPEGNTGRDPYGYLWRVIPPEAGLGRGFYHAGLGVHLLAVLKDHGLVVVHRVDTDRPVDITWPKIKALLAFALNKLGLLNTAHEPLK